MRTQKVFGLFVLIILTHGVYSQQLYNDDISRFDFAKNLFAAGKYAQSIDYCSDILYRSRNADVFELRAKCYRALGDYDNAAKDYSEAMQQGKRDAQIFEDRGMVNFCVENFEKAEQDFTEAMRLLLLDDPHMATYNFLLYDARARTYLQMGQYQDALADFTIALENGSPTASIDILSPLLHLGKMQEIQDYTSQIFNAKPGEISLLSDSSLKYYVTALYMLSVRKDASSALHDIDNAIEKYHVFGKSCYKTLINDMYYTKACISQEAGNDSTAYVFYTKAYNANNRQADIKPKVDYLKIKLGIDVTPPVITLINPQPDSLKKGSVNVTTGSLELYGKVQDTSGVLSLTVNNKSISKLEEDGLFVADLDLQPGANNIVITALDKFENKATTTITINLVSADTAAEEDVSAIPELFTYANYHAVLIGEKDYQDAAFPDLESPASDVLELKRILSTYYQFSEKNITTLINSGRENILDSLGIISNSMKKEDNLLIFYAGHGAVKKIGTNIIGGYIVPSDARKDSYSSFIRADDLKEAIQSSQAGHILFVLDACFAGTLFRRTIDDAPKNIQTLYRQKSRQMISSGNVEEVPDKGEFIQHLEDFLTDNRKPYLSSFELFSFLKNNAEVGSPQWGAIRDLGDSGGDFIFLKK